MRRLQPTEKDGRSSDDQIVKTQIHMCKKSRAYMSVESELMVIIAVFRVHLVKRYRPLSIFLERDIC